MAKKSAKKSTKKAARRHGSGAAKSRKVTKAGRKVGRKTAAARASQNGRAPSGVRAGKMVYYFGRTKTEGRAGMRELLGGKGANLADMTSIGLPVPPGFTITTDTCAA